MAPWLSRIFNKVKCCWSPVDSHAGARVIDRHDDLRWHRDLLRHAAGEYSFGVVQANSLLEDHSQVETGNYGTFVGIYDGHGGPETAKFVNNHLFPNVVRFCEENGGLSDHVLHKAILETEEGFARVVRRNCRTRPQVAAVGSCCLVGAVVGSTLYVANLGDSRAILGSLNRTSNAIEAIQILTEHSASLPEVRDELFADHPDEPRIVEYNRQAWRVKGVIQVSRAIGDRYLKDSEYSSGQDPLYRSFQLREPLLKPALSAVPTTYTREILPEDQFVIFASDGLWELLENQEAVDIVRKNRREGIAKHLITAALEVAARRCELSYAELQSTARGTRRSYHDDITVVVLYFDQEAMAHKADIPPSSVKAWVDRTLLSVPDISDDLFTTGGPRGQQIAGPSHSGAESMD